MATVVTFNKVTTQSLAVDPVNKTAAVSYILSDASVINCFRKSLSVNYSDLSASDKATWDNFVTIMTTAANTDAGL